MERIEPGYQETANGEKHNLPPIVLAELGPRDPTKATVVVYCNYDVRAIPGRDVLASKGGAPGSNHAKSEERANTVPSVNGSAGVAENGAPNDAAPLPFAEEAGYLHGTGLRSGKASLAAWILVGKVFQQLNLPMPVNVKVVCEGMRYSQSECLSELVDREVGRTGFLSDIDYLVVTDGSSPVLGKPSLISSLRGLTTIDIQVTGASRTVPSGPYAAAVAEPMTDLVQLLAVLSGSGHGTPGFSSLLKGLPETAGIKRGENGSNENVDFDVAGFRTAAGDVPALAPGLAQDEVLSRTSRGASVSIHGIEGAYSGPGVNMITPSMVSGKVSVRFGAGQNTETIVSELAGALDARFKQLKSPNELVISSVSSEPWVGNPSSDLYAAAAQAFVQAHDVEPSVVGSGDTIPMIPVLQLALQCDAVVVPLYTLPDPTDKASVPLYSEDEPISRKQYLDSIVLLGALMDEIGRNHTGREEATPVSSGPARTVTGPFQRIRDVWRGLA